MSRVNVWHQVPVNTSNRPIFVQGEMELFSRDHVGLYQGKSKFRALQNGRIYLTTKRVVFVDSSSSCAVAVYLRQLNKTEYIDKFLRSSPKVKLYLRPEEEPEMDTAPLISDWVCAVCSFNNHYDHRTEHVPKCVACGISASAVQVKALQKLPKEAINRGSGSEPKSVPEIRSGVQSEVQSGVGPDVWPESKTEAEPGQCGKCTFLNHPSMRFCEMCGTPLKTPSKGVKLGSASNMQDVPEYLQLTEPEVYTNNEPYVKISFRKGGHREFYELATSEIDNLKWKELQAKGAVNSQAKKVSHEILGQEQKWEPNGIMKIDRKEERNNWSNRENLEWKEEGNNGGNSEGHVTSKTEVPRRKVVHGGISAIEKSEELKRLKNERALLSSLNDLDQLRVKVHDMRQLAQSFSSVVKKKGGRGGVAGNVEDFRANLGEESTQELARNLSEYLVNYELTKPTAMATVQDVFASYNRFRLASQGFGGQLVGPDRMLACMQYLDQLQLPIKTKTFSSGLKVLTQRLGNSEQELHAMILDYMISDEDNFMLKKFEKDVLALDAGRSESNEQNFELINAETKNQWYRGKSVVDIAEHFGWATTICTEELERCLEKALLVKDNHISGTFYHVNKFDPALLSRLKPHDELRNLAREKVVLQQHGISETLHEQYTSSHNLLALQDYEFGLEIQGQKEQKTEGHGQSHGQSQSQSQIPYSESLMQLDGLRFD